MKYVDCVYIYSNFMLNIDNNIDFTAFYEEMKQEILLTSPKKLHL